MTVALVVAAAAAGAVVRHLVATGTREARTGIVVVNVVGSFVLGVLVGSRLGGDLSASALTVLGTGFCGALTTWSTFAHGVAVDLRDGRSRPAALHVALSLGPGLLAAAAGLAVA